MGWSGGWEEGACWRDVLFWLRLWWSAVVMRVGFHSGN